MNKPENTIGVSEMENQYDKSAPCSSHCSSALDRIADGLAKRHERERVAGLAKAVGVCVCGCPKSQHPRGWSCATDDCECHEYKDNSVARCSACGVAFEEHAGVQPTCQRLQAAEVILQQLWEEFCPSDSYGVHGSDFRTCKRCHTGGSPTRPWKHADDCEIKKIEDYLFGLD